MRAAKGGTRLLLAAVVLLAAALSPAASASLPAPGERISPSTLEAFAQLALASELAGAAGDEPASGVWSFGLFDPVSCGGGLFGGECAEARALANLKLHLGVLDLGTEEQPQASQRFRCETAEVTGVFAFHGRPVDEATGLIYFRHRWYSTELGRFVSTDPMGYADGPSLYSFAGNDPLNMADPFGLKRVELQPDPKGRRALEIRDRYRQAYELAKSLPEAGAKLAAIEASDSFTLEIVYDPDYKKGLVLEPAEFDEEGRTTRATLRVGEAFPHAPTHDEWYPFGYKLHKKKEVGVYTVTHEEVGHFLTSATDASYNAEKTQFGALIHLKNQRLAEIRKELLAQIEASDASERRKRRQRRNVNPEVYLLGRRDPVVQKGTQAEEDAHLFVEGIADRAGAAAVLELRSQRKGGDR